MNWKCIWQKTVGVFLLSFLTLQVFATIEDDNEAAGIIAGKVITTVFSYSHMLVLADVYFLILSDDFRMIRSERTTMVLVCLILDTPLR